MKRLLVLYLAVISAICVFGAEDIFDIHTYTTGTYNTKHNSCEWFRNSSDSILINFGIIPSGIIPSDNYNARYWTEPELVPGGVMDYFPGLSLLMAIPYRYYNRPTQSADIRYYKVDKTLVVPDSIFVDTPEGVVAKNYITGKNESRIGFPVVTIGTYCFSPNFSKEPNSLYGLIENELKAGTAESFIDFKIIVLPESLTDISSYAFDGNTALEEINLENVAYIGDYAFRGCSGLKNIWLRDLYSIGERPFEGVKVDTLRITNGIPGSTDKLFGFSSMETVILESTLPYAHLPYFRGPNTIVDGVTTELPPYFGAGSVVETVTLCSSIEKFGGRAFEDATSLKAIYLYAAVPPVFSGYKDGEYYYQGKYVPFDGVDKANCTLYVPSASVNLYKADPIWKDFLIKAMDDGIECVPTDNPRVVKTECFDIQGRRIAHPEKGQFCVFVDIFSDGSRKCHKKITE